MKRILTLVSAAVILLSSCIHQFPDSRPAQVDLTLTFNTEMSYFKTVAFPDETTKSTELKNIDPDLFRPDFSDHAQYDVRYVVQAYRVVNGSYDKKSPSARWVFTEDDASKMDDYHLSVTLDEGLYIFMAWADYVKPDTDSDLFWHTTDWYSGIALNYADGYDGNTEWRDAYIGSTEVEVIRYGAIEAPVSGTISMNRPHGKYYFLTNDLDEFITKVRSLRTNEFDINDYIFEVTYTSFMPDSYNPHSDRSNDAHMYYKFSSGLTQVDETRAVMGFDHVITGTNEGTWIEVALVLKDRDGTVLAEHSGVNIQVNPNQYTLVEGRFLMQESSGGVAIDPGFNGPDFIVPVN